MGSPLAEAAPVVPVVHVLGQKVMSKFFAFQLVYGRGQYFWLKLFSAIVAVPSVFLQKAPMQQSSLLAFAAGGSRTTGYCQPLNIATMRVFKLKQILHHVMTMFFTGGTFPFFGARDGHLWSVARTFVLGDSCQHAPSVFQQTSIQEVRLFHRVQENTPTNMNGTHIHKRPITDSHTCHFA